jgi:hypothetical protein
MVLPLASLAQSEQPFNDRLGCQTAQPVIKRFID